MQSPALHVWLFSFIFQGFAKILLKRNVKMLLKKMTYKFLRNINNLKFFRGKKLGGFYKQSFSAAMHGWGVFSNNKRYSMQKKEIFEKFIYSTKTSMIISIFSEYLVKFLRNSISYLVLKAVSVHLRLH